MPDGVRQELARFQVLVPGNRKLPPEDSIALRVAVLGAVLTGTLALVLQGVLTGPAAVFALPALVIAHYVSYRQRAATSSYLKLALTAFGVMALWSFVGEAGGGRTFEEGRSSLALLFVWVQVLAGFDLPARRSLYLPLLSSLAMILFAASASRGPEFALVLLIYAVFALAALVLAHRSQIQDGISPRGPGLPSLPSWSWRDIARAGVATIAATALVFMLLPQPRGAITFGLPFSVGSGIGLPSSGGVANPGFDSAPSARSSETSYYGFSERMDLRVRGDLTDEVVMRVQASAPSLWRGLLFDTYDSNGWTGASGDPEILHGGPLYYSSSPWGDMGPRVGITQTFRIEAEQASVLFAAATPQRVWAASAPAMDELGGLRTGSTLTPGTVYSVVSSRGAASPRQLRAVPHYSAVAPHLKHYLQVPGDLPERVRELAEDITASATTDYDRVKAIEAFLRENYQYSIDSPVPPEGQDAVDHFLFDAKIGFCEQFASATAVMLRTLGIPARVAAGYTTGTRNPLTGLYEVKGSDAHAWVEVFFPGYGWYEFDPTFSVPPATATGIGETIPIVRLIRFAAQRFGDMAANSVAVGLALIAAAAVLLVAGLRTRRPRRTRTGSRIEPHARPGPVTRAWLRLEAALARHGTARRESETAAELALRAHHVLGKDAQGAVRAFEQERYGPTPPAQVDQQKAIESLEQMASAIQAADQ